MPAQGSALWRKRAEIPEQGSDWPSVGHMPIFRPITAVRGWDIKTGSPIQKHMLRKGRTGVWKGREVWRKPKGLLWSCSDLPSRPARPIGQVEFPKSKQGQETQATQQENKTSLPTRCDTMSPRGKNLRLPGSPAQHLVQPGQIPLNLGPCP